MVIIKARICCKCSLDKTLLLTLRMLTVRGSTGLETVQLTQFPIRYGKKPGKEMFPFSWNSLGQSSLLLLETYSQVTFLNV